MNKKSQFTIFLLIIIAPIIMGNSISITWYHIIGFLALFTLLPISIIESAVAFIIIREKICIKLNFLYTLLIVSVANITSALFGLISIFLDLSINPWFYFFGHLIISIITEAIIIYLFIKNRTDKSMIQSFIVSLWINGVTYFIIGVILFATYGFY